MMKSSKTFLLGLVFVVVAGVSFIVTPTGFAACPDDIVSYWKLDNSVAGGGYVDFINGNHGTGAGSLAAAAGIVNNAAGFDGLTTGINIKASSTFG